jgi:ATP-dependent Lhr-like helicase
MESLDIHPALLWAHPLVQEWFTFKFGTPTEPQEQGWPHILAGHTTLLSAPTGSGKTLAAFLACIDGLVRKALSGDLQDRTEVLYVSPLKALGNDIHKNLELPLGEIVQLAGRQGRLMPAIRTAVRSGDTLVPERRAMLKRPPHILVTTPESLYILLTAEKSRAVLRDVGTVIVDEIHAVAGSKRGAHLALSLERLEQVARRSPARIGLSATQKPLDKIAHFLTGAGRPAPVVVDIGHRRTMDIGIEVPRSELGAVASHGMWDEIYDRIAELVRAHRSTLVFVNTRRLAERIAMHLATRLGEGAVTAHHGSLSRKLRLAAEKKLKEGAVAVLVATASLELGIDIGFVDLVVQIGSPRSIAVGLQRIGRSGHWRGATPKARLFATTRDELLESAALVRSIHHGELDRIIMPEAPLDVLAQQMVAEVAASKPAYTPEDTKGREGTPFTREGTEDAETHRGKPIDSNPGFQSAEGTPGSHSPRFESRIPDSSSASSEPALSGAEGSSAVNPSENGYREDELYALATRAYPYRDLPRLQFDNLIAMLSEGIAARRGRYGAYLHRDRVHRRLSPRRGARLAAITSGGAIPSNGLFTMVSMPEGTPVGTLDEDFVTESTAGDVLLLGSTSWRIRRIETSSGRVLVEDAQGAPPSVPFWLGEAPARTAELSTAVADLRQQISGLLPNAAANAARLPVKSGELNAALQWLESECGLDESGAEQAVDHVLMGRAVLGAVPTQETVIAERFFDEGGGMQLVIHAPFGARVNKAWGLALRKRFCRSFNFELQAAATDDGLNLALAEQHSFPLSDVFHYLQPETVKDVLEQAVLTAQSPIFKSRWRWDAERALALLRFQHGRKVPPQIQRMRADDLLASVFPDVAACFENIEGDIRIPEHPLVQEVMKDVLHEAMDLDGLVAVLRRIESGSIRCVAVDTPAPSQFSHEILNANPYAFLDDAPLEERRARAVELRRMLPESVLQEVGRLDPQAIAQVRQEAWPDVRDADELHDVLQTLVGLRLSHPGAEGGAGLEHSPLPGTSVALTWHEYFQQLAASGRAGIAEIQAGAVPWSGSDARFWVCAEQAHTFECLHPEAHWQQRPAEVQDEGTVSQSEAVFAAVKGWMQHLGPITAAQLAQWLVLPGPQVEQALLQLEAGGGILRGHFTTPGPGGNEIEEPGAMEWCDRRLLARIHRLTVGRLRKEIEPATPAEFMRWLLRWQHLAPGTQVRGERGLLEVLQQLQGFETAANAWEGQVLARRVADYDPKTLDQLCLGGAVGWGRLSPHPATLHASASSGPEAGVPTGGAARGTHRVIPTSVAPITFFVREEADWMHSAPAVAEPQGLSPGARRIHDFLQQRGASFFPDLVRETGLLKAEIETALWELVAAGLVTADGFDNLRALIDPKRRAGHGHARTARPRHSVGRWALLRSPSPASAAGEVRARGVESTCWMLLRRYGVVFRELLARETVAPRWRELQLALRRLEDRGEIRGGRFVSGFLGEQFALPAAVESLRAERKRQPAGEVITISAADPLNLVGVVVPGERVAAVSGNYVAFRDGIAVEPPVRVPMSIGTPVVAAG